MGLSIKNDRLEQSVRRLASRRGLGVTSAIQLAVDNELARDDPPKKDPEKVLAALREIQERVRRLPVIDPAVNADEWMYDENGLPH
jgi:hypothetical protein